MFIEYIDKFVPVNRAMPGGQDYGCYGSSEEDESMSYDEIKVVLTEKSFEPIKYNKVYEPLLIEFLGQCLPESGRFLDINGRHSCYKDIENSFKSFWCMFDSENIIGTVAVKELDHKSCELKSLYLLERYHGMGYGKCLLQKAIAYANEYSYEKMYLDSLSTSKKAIALYRKTGFVDTERYNKNEYSDVFMVLDLKQ